jgi:hypothetical protein
MAKIPEETTEEFDWKDPYREAFCREILEASLMHDSPMRKQAYLTILSELRNIFMPYKTYWSARGGFFSFESKLRADYFRLKDTQKSIASANEFWEINELNAIPEVIWNKYFEKYKGLLRSISRFDLASIVFHKISPNLIPISFILNLMAKKIGQRQFIKFVKIRTSKIPFDIGYAKDCPIDLLNLINSFLGDDQHPLIVCKDEISNVVLRSRVRFERIPGELSLKQFLLKIENTITTIFTTSENRFKKLPSEIWV